MTTTTTGSITTLVHGLTFPEGPRWHDGRFWCSDMHSGRVIASDLDGNVEDILVINGDMPSGLGWLPDGTLLVVSMERRQILAVAEGATRVHADASSLPGEHLNDMVVNTDGRAYVGSREPRGMTMADMSGIDMSVRETVLVVEPDGTPSVAADDMIAPNGSVITPDGSTLIVAETRAHRLTAFDIQADGSLTNRRVYADVAPLLPDGIALDEAGAVWFGSPVTGVFARTLPGGEITDRIVLPEGKWATACALGGPDRRTLFLATSRTTLDNLAKLRDPALVHTSDAIGWIETVPVAVPGAGLP